MSDVKVAFIGLGNMGFPMAERLLGAGFEVTVLSRTTESAAKLVDAGALTAQDPASAAAQADFILTCLPTPAVVEEVYLGRRGVLEGARSEATAADLSTIDPKTTLRISQACKEKSVNFADAPVSGGVQRARAGTLTVMVGGDPEVTKALEPVLSQLGTTITHVGETGSGQLTKLCNNMVAAITEVALGEVMVAGLEAGLSTDVLFNVLKHSSADSFVLSSYFPHTVFPEERPTAFSLDLMAKDIDLFMESMGHGRVPLLLSGVARAVFRVCQDRNLGGRDASSVVEFYEGLAGARLQLAPGHSGVD